MSHRGSVCLFSSALGGCFGGRGARLSFAGRVGGFQNVLTPHLSISKGPTQPGELLIYRSATWSGPIGQFVAFLQRPFPVTDGKSSRPRRA